MYALDTNSARKADSGGSMINEVGKYIGTFTQAEDITAATGTKGVAMVFESGGKKARLSLYTKKADGTTIQGSDLLMAILTCMKLRGIRPVAGKVTAWDNEARQEFEKQAMVFPELCGKQIGLLLETEDYLKSNGVQAEHPRLVIKNVFQAGTELTASEILDRKTSPEMLPKMVAALRHRPLKNAPKPRQSDTYGAGDDAPWPDDAATARPHTRTAAPSSRAAPASSGFDDMDGDIPF